MKKIISILSCISILGAHTAVMAETPTDDCVVAVYQNGSLYSCANGTYADGAAYADIRLPEGEYLAKAFFTDSGIVEIKEGFLNPVSEAVPSPTPSATVAPEPTPAPTAAPEKAPRPTYHPAYETEKDAIEAFAVVDSVNVVDVNGENKYRIDALYHGAEAEFIVDEDMTISAAPDAFAELNGASLHTLKKGDVIMITCRTSGSIKRIDLIMRPAKEDIITGSKNYGTGFEQLFSTNGFVGGNTAWRAVQYGSRLSSDETAYVFGVIRNKDRHTIELVNKGGLENDAFYIDLSDNVIVYTCDVAERNELSSGSAADILRSEIANADMDDDNNVVVWEAGKEYNYALVRVVDEVAVEMVVYTGYAE